MKAVVLAGGYATRLWPVTRHRPKMLLPVGETTVIDTILSQLEADDRIEDVFVSTNERFAEDFRDHVADTGFEKPQLSIEDTTDEDEKFGVVGALAQLVEREGIADEDLLVIAGDNLISFDVADFIDFFEETGTPESYLEAVAWALDGDSIVADSATVENTTVGENVHIMADATVHEADIDGSLVFPGATVADSTIRDSIIDSEATIHDLDLSGALIGSHSRISNGE